MALIAPSPQISVFSSRRAAGVMSVVAILLIALIGRVAFLQTYGRQKTIQRAERQQHQTETLISRRGSIFDCNGMLMAGTVQSQSLFVDPKFMQDCFQEDGKSLVELDKAIGQLAQLIDKDPFELSKLLGDRYESRFVKVAEHLDEQTCAAIEKLDLPGIGFTPTAERFYPMGSIAAHVLGGTQKDNIGLEGVELKFEKLLAGKNGFKRTLKDARRRPIAVAADDYLPAENGQHLILTIDSNIQMIAEQELARTCEDYRANRGEAIVVDPKTGDIYAMTNWPTFNPQNLEDSAPKVRSNRCIVDPYEPGSTIKPFIAGPAFAWKVTRPTEIFPIHGPHYVTPYGRKVTDVHGYDQLAMWDVLVKSSNIGMSMLGERMGNPSLYKALTGFNFGKQTGVELPGENPGKVNPLVKWNKYSTESVSQGYELMVTPLQLARGFCAYANGGRLVSPHLIKGVLNSDGDVVSRNAPKALDMLPEVIDPVTAATMKRILCDVVIRGTAMKARSSVWNIFGKTGTAHVSNGKGGYSDKRYTSSFMGGAPAENPRLVVMMVIHEPDIDYANSKGLSHYGGAVAAPGASRILERCLAYLQVPASPDLPIPPPQIANVLYAFDAKMYTNRTASAKE
jgi:cell division protein FtsI/penicillin-binding protein 2